MNNSNFFEQYTRSEFKQKENLSSKLELYALERLKNFDNESYLERHLNGEELTREQTYKVLHCYICDKIHINNSYRYCSSCKYFIKELFLK